MGQGCKREVKTTSSAVHTSSFFFLCRPGRPALGFLLVVTIRRLERRRNWRGKPLGAPPARRGSEAEGKLACRGPPTSPTTARPAPKRK